MLIGLNEAVTTSEAELADYQETNNCDWDCQSRLTDIQETSDCDWYCQYWLEDREEAISFANRLIPFIQVVLGFIALELTIALIACSPCSPCFDTCRRGRCGELAEFN